MADLAADATYEAYEVFVQYNALDPHVYVGSVLAASPDMALLVARENFLRRDKAVSLWVVPKQSISVKTSEDKDFFACEFDRDYRRVDGYADNARRWKAFKQKALHLEDIVKD
ncbi:phenylacetic acid degradation protein [Alicyclobacillus cycloheptanicus]|jgi:ring-1,2-phenylacetyl-CoA epoxidase subunit PaaB|uniref:Ring-1,2-phenylacetyl-CoA epoxidase subunit PaaB n=1 Tax=Alicyclobacillus cycloheptanicus TaxID=1457 RepID=A0ABT9XER8_9BACL|nr:phenylacetic acid degradation protein [Alicyclobacillus cycloheptanicus]MDQ0188687.1 ring-1,2-phenylacetyl-CoA epoxidase subunit PaaB [Alicyclobacillus cycloheptanicus]WDM00641.1 phenylacetic acid degradation protein [Alicyclobacillus cycloheptanicus]